MRINYLLGCKDTKSFGNLFDFARKFIKVTQITQITQIFYFTNTNTLFLNTDHADLTDFVLPQIFIFCPAALELCSLATEGTQEIAEIFNHNDYLCVANSYHSNNSL
jgi:hypothetical protein